MKARIRTSRRWRGINQIVEQYQVTHKQLKAVIDFATRSLETA
ncbi:MAG: hypothetical protein ABJC09_03710 [Terriglobia bacterium]